MRLLYFSTKIKNYVVICSYKTLPIYRVPISQPSPYRFFSGGNVFNSNHFSQSPNTYNTTTVKIK